MNPRLGRMRYEDFPNYRDIRKPNACYRCHGYGIELPYYEGYGPINREIEPEIPYEIERDFGDNRLMV
jgi:hypothetical protein